AASLVRPDAGCAPAAGRWRSFCRSRSARVPDCGRNVRRSISVRLSDAALVCLASYRSESRSRSARSAPRSFRAGDSAMTVPSAIVATLTAGSLFAVSVAAQQADPYAPGTMPAQQPTAPARMATTTRYGERDHVLRYVGTDGQLVTIVSG